MKPVVAGPSDQVCTSAAGLFLNGRRWVAAASYDVRVVSPPVWQECRPLNNDEFFMLSGYAANSFDSRCFRPVKADNVVGVYQLIF